MTQNASAALHKHDPTCSKNVSVMLHVESTQPPSLC